MTKIKAKIQLRRDTSANFTSVNPTLLLGEFAFETDTMVVTEGGSVSVKLKIGDGVNPWTELPYTTFGFQAVTWEDITGKPTEFAPAPHMHEIADVIGLEATLEAIADSIPDISGLVPYTGATGNVDLGEFKLKAGQIELDQTPTGTAGVGVMRWNDTDGTVDVGLKGGNVTLQVGQESVIRVVNKSGVNLLEANYQAVRVRLVAEGGAQGQRLAVVLALADTDADSATTIGLVTETINNNQEGFVTTSGEVKGINTTGSLQGETWVDGDILYLSGTTSGRITNVKPSAPTHTIIIGYVVYAHANNGKIFVKVDNGYELDELHNVLITSPANNEVLTYDSATSLWKNETIASALGFTPENTANKQNSLAPDGTGVKFPTVDAVNNQSMLDKGKIMFSVFTDFVGSNLPDGMSTFQSGGTTNFVGSIPQRTNQQGVLAFQTGAFVTGYIMCTSGGLPQIWLGGGVWNYETSINLLAISTSIERYRLIIGFGSANNINSETNGVFFTYDEGGTANGNTASPNWICITSAGNVRTLTITSVPVTATTWDKLRIEINATGTSVSFFINGTLVATHTTNIPQISSSQYIFAKQGIFKTIGTGNRIMYMDYIGYENMLTIPRL